MTPVLASALLPVLRALPPERGHALALRALRCGLAGRAVQPGTPALAVAAFGRLFRNPIGLAAGFDKDAVALRPLAALGFGFVEAGTVTPLPQPGNRRPRLFRLDADRAVINRMGMNGAGLAAFVSRLAAMRRRGIAVPVGVNIGINRDGAAPERDYPALVSAVAPFADYVAINVSSPNTPGLRDLQAAAPLEAILRAIGKAVPDHPPLLVKVAPDLSEADLAAVVETAIAHGAAGLIVSNTTTRRPATLRDPQAAQAGGLSGAPLFPLATIMLARASLLSGGRLLLVGVGGVASGEDVLTKLRAGATLVQLYTAFALQGPALIPRLLAELAAALRAAGFARVQDAIGADAARLAEAGAWSA